MWCKVIWLMVEIVVLELNMVLGAKYHNDVHGNTVQVDKSTGFHVFELHGFSVGGTSSVFLAAFLILCATYIVMKLGLSKVLCCCCHCYGSQERIVESGLVLQHMQMMQQQQPQSIQMLNPMQLQSRNANNNQDSLDLPRVLNLKVMK